MIISGSKEKFLIAKDIINRCNLCSWEDATLVVKQRYFHMFWVPMFPVRKTGYIICRNCNRIMRKKEFPHQLAEQWKDLRAEVRTPIYLFTGTVVFVAFGIFMAVIANNEKKEYRDLLLAPVIGDIYEIVVDKDYSLNKVTRVTSDSIGIISNTCRINYMHDDELNKFDRDKYWDKLDTKMIARTRLLTMLDNNEIKVVIRK